MSLQTWKKSWKTNMNLVRNNISMRLIPRIEIKI